MQFVLIVLAVVGTLWGLAIFLGVVTGVGKTFQKTPESVSVQSEKIKNKSQQSAEDARIRQKELMDSLKQKMSDHRR